jgi:hypothetical protein
MELSKLPLFGSQLIDSSSKTPYSDATQVNFDSTTFQLFPYPQFKSVIFFIT